MNDRLKFRVWCENKQEWEKDEILISSKGNMVLNQKGMYIVKNEMPKFHIIEFCTGLKDKNGKLGYHKDFIKNNYGDVFLIEWDEQKLEYCIVNVIYLRSGIDLQQAIIYNSISFDLELVKEWEVIGNIHQNSELLEAK